jgi:hypothetical protein
MFALPRLDDLRCGVTVRDWEALCWTLPVIQLADIGLARELLLRMWRSARVRLVPSITESLVT